MHLKISIDEPVWLPTHKQSSVLQNTAFVAGDPNGTWLAPQGLICKDVSPDIVR